MRAIAGAMAIVGLLGLAAVAMASELQAVEVYQPIDTENEIVVSAVTYLGYFGSAFAAPYRALLHTCDATDVFAPYAPRNRNVAFHAGFKIEPGAGGATGRQASRDTLRVMLRVPAHRVSVRVSAFPDSVVIAATTQCILANAARDSATRYVDLSISGSPEARHLGGVFSLAPFRAGPTRRSFH